MVKGAKPKTASSAGGRCNNFLVSVAAIFMAGAALAAGGGTPAKRVLFIGSDGMSAAVLRRSDVKAPTLRGLMARGAWSLKARTILPSSSAANWASMFQCSGPEQNGYNEWNSRKPIMPPAAVDANGRFPDIFYRFRAARPNAKIGYAYGWQGMPFVVDTNVCDFVVQTNAAQKVVLDWIRSAKPDLMAVVFSPPDGAGHKYGWRSPEYLSAVEAVDADIGRVIAAYEEAGLLAETLVVFTSDHGGIEKKHGGTTLDEMERPLFFAGPGVKRGYEIPWVTLCPDVGATIAYVLGIPSARVWTGRVIDDIFEP